MKLDELAGLVQQERGSMGIRAAAREIGISPTTLTKIEHGHIPDMKTLNKVCTWIGKDPEKFAGIGGLQIAFKKKTTVSKATAISLAALIENASKQFEEKIEAEGH